MDQENIRLDSLHSFNGVHNPFIAESSRLNVGGVQLGGNHAYLQRLYSSSTTFDL